MVLGMKSAGMVALVLFGLLAGCGGRTSLWWPTSIDAQNSRPAQLRVSQGVMKGLLIRYVNPVTPGDVQVRGDVTVWFWVDKNGAVESVRALDGHPMLIPAAIEAVKQWRYMPYLLNGEPVAVETTAVVHFGK